MFPLGLLLLLILLPLSSPLSAPSSMPVSLYASWFPPTIPLQPSELASLASKAVASASRKHRLLEVSFPPVPNLEEVDFGTPLNKRFSTRVASALGARGGYRPGSLASRNQVSFANLYWARQLAPALRGSPLPFGGRAAVLNSGVRPGDVSKLPGSLELRPLRSAPPASPTPTIAVSPGPSGTWKQLSSYSGSKPFLVLNNAVNDSYDLGNAAGFETAFYLKRVSRGWAYRAYPGPWCAYLEKPDGSTELLKTYAGRPRLRELAKVVREESFKRYAAVGNDRWMNGRL